MAHVIDRAAIDRMIATLTDEGYTVVGPTVSGDAVVLEAISSTADLPVGVTSDQEPGAYRLATADREVLFGATPGPGSPKRFLHPPEAVVFRARRDGTGYRPLDETAPPPVAFVGIRPCDVAAMAIQDRVFLGGAHRDAVYDRRRGGAVVIVVNCTQPGGTCFCASMDTGPRATDGFDVAITEIVDGDDHWFLAEAGSPLGERLLEGSDTADASRVQAVAAAMDRARASMGRRLETEGLADALADSLESPRWEAIAQRCLTCANCTLVCPTCFCATVDDETSLVGDEAVRVRRWDSCFNEEFSYIHGGALRPSPSARYRQWLTHKLSTWVDQFGTFGCVGCGRCITWCPVGIDLTVEAAALVEEATHG